MQKIVTDAIRPERRPRPARRRRGPRRGSPQAYRFLETELPAAPWALGADFGLADCAAAPGASSTPTWCSPSARPSRALKAYLGHPPSSAGSSPSFFDCRRPRRPPARRPALEAFKAHAGPQAIGTASVAGKPRDSTFA